ncbi:MAG: hypothetical protein HZC37_27395 [Burkholderiales bacterium]|nr:hypothetical protein [Burkholderiales bacterium]
MGILAVGTAVVVYVFTRPDDPVALAVQACTGGTKQAVDFGLRAGIGDTGAIVAGAGLTKQMLGSLKPADSVEGTKQQFNYIACIDRRLAAARAPQVAASCSDPNDPCVDIVRLADFTKSACPAEGGPGPVDLAEFYDTVSFSVPGVQRYEAVGSPSGRAKLTVLRQDGQNLVQVPAVEQPRCATCPSPEFTFNIPVVDGRAEYRWRWVDGHDGDPVDGLFVKSLARVRSVHAHIKLPHGVTLDSKSVEPPEVARKCVVGHNSLACTDLSGAEMRRAVKWAWDWTLWSRCRGK